MSDPEKNLVLNQVHISEPWYEALYSPMIVAVGLLGPLPMSDTPLQATYTLGTCQTSMMCMVKTLGQIFWSDPEKFAP